MLEIICNQLLPSCQSWYCMGIPPQRATSPYGAGLQKRLKESLGGCGSSLFSGVTGTGRCSQPQLLATQQTAAQLYPRLALSPQQPVWMLILDRTSSLLSEELLVTSSEPKQKVAFSEALHAVVFRWRPKPRLVCSDQNRLAPHM